MIAMRIPRGERLTFYTPYNDHYMKISLVQVLVVLAALLGGPLLAAQGAAPVPGELIVRLEEGVGPAAFTRAFAAHRRAAAGLSLGYPIARRFNIHLFRFDPGRVDGAALLAQVRTHPGVISAQFNYEVQFRSLPDDPEFSRQWGLLKIGADKVWEISTGGRTARGDDIVVAVLDSGFDIDHEDLRDNIWVNRGEVPADGIDNDGNGLIDDVRGWNFVDSSAMHRIDQHGLSVAGIVGARGNNGIGVTGVNWDVQLMVLDIRFVDQIIAAYTYVVEQRDRYNKSNGREGAFVVATNASFGQNKTFCEEQPVWGGMYDLLGQVGVLSTAGAANNAWDIEEEGDMPTTCPSEYLLTVLNTNEADERHQGSAYGQVSIDMGAPGQGSYTTKPFNNYGLFNGNSAAVPHLAGAVASLYSLPCEAIAESALDDPAATARQIGQALLDGVTIVPGLEEYTATGGRLNLFQSMEIVQDLCGGTTGPLDLLSLAPNPVHDELRVIFETPDFEPCEFRVYNMMGQEIFRDEVIPSRFSTKQYRIPTWQWAPGVYVVSIRRGKEVVSEKFLVQH